MGTHEGYVFNETKHITEKAATLIVSSENNNNN